MTNNLSPVDPIFFLHHSNMDRLWDVWTRKQKNRNLPYLPVGDDLKTYSDEPFLFYVGGDGKYVGPSKAGDYISTDVFDYNYTPGTGEKIVEPPAAAVAARRALPLLKGTLKANVASVAVPNAAIENHLADTLSQPLVAVVTIPRPSGLSNAREFDVLVNAPPGVTQVSADSPYYAGTVAFFGIYDARHENVGGCDLYRSAAQESASVHRAACKRANTTRAEYPVGAVTEKSGPAPTLKAISVGTP